MSSHLSEALLKKRKQLGIGYELAARKAGVSEKWLWDVEHGKTFQLFQRLHAVAVVYGISPYRILQAAWLDSTGQPLVLKGGTPRITPSIISKD